MSYELIEPESPCISPDGHERIEVASFASAVPEDVVCGNCGKSWTVVTFQTAEAV